MTLSILEPAEAELRAAALAYDAREPGLGRWFRNDVARTVDWIRRHPKELKRGGGGYRAVNLHSFPCYIAYHVEHHRVYVLAVAPDCGGRVVGLRR